LERGISTAGDKNFYLDRTTMADSGAQTAPVPTQAGSKIGKNTSDQPDWSFQHHIAIGRAK
jgi:hypothetical protein